MKTRIRLADDTDAKAVLDIYAPFVCGSPVTFEVEPPTVDEMQRRIGSTGERYPWLVCVGENRALGYAYASEHRTRAAYGWSVDCSVYIDPRYCRRGIARGLYTSLFALLRLQGFFNVFAGITLPNAASVGLHEAIGFKAVGVYRAVGYKLGAWHDVGWWQLPLQAPLCEPPSPIPLARLARDGSWDAAMRSGLAILQI
ncbi:arsinothricin resistance N-acetyltransferase ArsN1 family B [Gloeobacter morelensis]|uniref:N-acetyltransferase n=1 Tax=Gloeobacter morelensis MG652769 TaxID=2781736 RepID=A0ABY3PMB2_9CYAN|nr:arsinothricin resistance N-acetyltransferase ArsN1 family B [Gloeobacter morelensis]UFP94552.1 N-acetyltransferase [Gloeobacter morelensis MG652769]